MAANNHSEIVLSSPPCSPTHSPQAVHTNKEQCSTQGIHPETTPGYYAYYPAPPQQHPGSPPSHPYPGGPPQPGHQYPGGPPPGHPYPGPPPGHPYPGGPPPGYYGPPDHQGPYGPPAGYYPQYGPPPPSGQHSYHFYPAQHADEPMHADAQPPNSHASTTQSSTAFVPAAQPIQVRVDVVDSGNKEKRPMSNAKKAVLASAAVVFGLSLPSLIFFFPLGVLLLLVAGFLFLIALCMW